MTSRSCLAAILMLLLAGWCRAAAPATRPAAAPLDPLIIEAADAVNHRTLKAFTLKVEQELEPLLIGLNPGDFDRITELASLREFARYFARLQAEKEKFGAEEIETLQWLLGKPQLRRTLMMAVSEADPPDKVLGVLSALHEPDQKDRLEDFPDLTVAICVVWDAPPRLTHSEIPAGAGEDATEPDPFKQPRLLFRYFTNARERLRFDTKTLPWPLATYLVDYVAGPDEMIWALNRYARRGAIGGAFFDVPYDMEHYGGYGVGMMNGRPYTLENLSKFGGICGDQAYYAVHVARSVGVPATICTGTGATEGTGHAWVGFLDVRGDRVGWNFAEGRYPENQYWQGRVIDPQTRSPISDADVSLLAELQRATPSQRLTSIALCKIADMFGEPKRADPYMQAIELSAGNPQPWQALARLGADLKLEEQQATQFRAAVEKFAVKRYPDFAMKLLLQSIAGRGTAQQIALLEGMRPLFASRPDLLALLRLMQGDAYRKDNRPADAMAAYGEVLDRYLNIAPIVLMAMQHVDTFLRDEGAKGRLVEIYRLVWQRMPQPESSVAVQGTPFYKIGWQYAQLLEEVGQHSAAQGVQARLDSLNTNVSTAGRH